MNRKRELKFFREAMNQNPDEVYIIDPETAQFTDVSESVVKMLGYSRKELLSLCVQDVDPNFREEMDWGEFVDELKTGGSKTFESINKRKNGSTFPVEIHADYITVQGTERVIATGRDITERKEAEERIKTQEKFLRTINNQLPGVTYQMKRHPDGSFSFPYMSEGLDELCALASETAMENADKLFEMVHPDDFEALMENINESADQLTRWQQEARFKHPETEMKWLRVSSQPEEMADGSVVWSGVMIDVTEEKLKEQELSTQKIRFQTLFKEAPIGLAEEDWSDVRTFLEQLDKPESEDLRTYLEGNPTLVRDAIQHVDTLLVNESLVKITGAQNQEHLIENSDRLPTEEAFESIRDELIRLWEGASSVSSVMKLRRFDGEQRHVLRDLRIVPGHEEDWSRMFLSCYDITERKRIEESLRESEKRYRTLFEKVNEAFLIVNVEDNILEANQNACELLGYAREKLIGLNVEKIIPSELVEETGQGGIVRTRMNNHGRSMIYTYLIDKDSTRIPVESSRAQINFGDQEAVILSIRDRSELERVRQKNQRKSTFVSQVTHDLRTPLNSITGMSSLLMDTELTGQQQTYLQTILNASRNMERLTNDILDLNRIERGEIILDEEPFNLQHLLGEVISLYSQELKTKNVTMSTNVSEEAPDRLIGDPDRLKQILHNLVDNAIKHTREGSIQIGVDLEQRQDTTVKLSFSVSDTGKGIPETEQDDIFEEHKQVETQRGGSGQGLGIGLKICRDLVNLMNGDIGVESAVDEGTTFTFTVELEEAKSEAGTASVALNDVNVLLVEDNAMVRKVFQTYLESHDINTVLCESGEAALDELIEANGSTYDVVFLDRRLGEMSGEEVLQKVSETKEAIDPERVYIISGDPAERIQERIDPLSCAGVMEKPIEESELINAVSSVVLTRSKQIEDKGIEELQEAVRNRSPDSFHILIADDDQNTRTLLEELLDPVADELNFVTNGKEAVEKRFEEEPHLVLMDLEMPEMNGLEATERIRKKEGDQNLPKVPLITQTAKAMKHVETKCLEAGADKFVRKPIKRRRLYRAILDVVKG
jgi:PAS domain S-box-containing protein